MGVDFVREFCTAANSIRDAARPEFKKLNKVTVKAVGDNFKNVHRKSHKKMDNSSFEKLSIFLYLNYLLKITALAWIGTTRAKRTGEAHPFASLPAFAGSQKIQWTAG